jgi:hypothetical protein
MPTREELEAMDREELRAVADEKGLEYSPHVGSSKLISLILAEEDEVDDEGDEEVGTEIVKVEAQAEAPPDPSPPYTLHPWELPANTVAAQAYIAANPGVVDETLEISEERAAAAQNEVELYGHPADPRLAGGSLLEAVDFAAPAERAEIEELEVVGNDGQTWGEKLAAESEQEEANA